MDEEVLFQRQYRIPSTRRKGWNYRDPGTYFVTICTKGRIPWFGTVRNGFVCLSDIGGIVYECWRDIPVHHTHVSIDRFIVMPNHVHGIIRINKCAERRIMTPDVQHASVVGTRQINTVETRQINTVETRQTNTVETRHVASLRGVSRNQYGPLSPGSLQSIVHSFKAAATKWIHRWGAVDFAWQPRFHDRIIRNEHALFAIRRYIVQNPIRWVDKNLEP